MGLMIVCLMGYLKCTLFNQSFQTTYLQHSSETKCLILFKNLFYSFKHLQTTFFSLIKLCFFKFLKFSMLIFCFCYYYITMCLENVIALFYSVINVLIEKKKYQHTKF